MAELHGVVEQVQQHLLDALCVTQMPLCGQAWCGHEFQRQAFLCRKRGDQPYRAGSHLGHRQRLLLEGDLVCLQRRQVDQIVEQHHELFRGRLHFLQHGPYIGHGRTLQCQFRHPHDERHGRAQLVPHIRQKHGFGAQCGFGRLLGHRKSRGALLDPLFEQLPLLLQHALQAHTLCHIAANAVVPSGPATGVEIGPASHFKPANFTVLARQRKDGQPFFLAKGLVQALRALGRQDGGDGPPNHFMRGHAAQSLVGRTHIRHRHVWVDAPDHVLGPFSEQPVLLLALGQVLVQALAVRNEDVKTHAAQQGCQRENDQRVLRVRVGLDAVGTQHQCQTGKRVSNTRSLAQQDVTSAYPREEPEGSQLIGLRFRECIGEQQQRRHRHHDRDRGVVLGGCPHNRPQRQHEQYAPNQHLAPIGRRHDERRQPQK